MGLLKWMVKGFGDSRSRLSQSRQSQVPTFEHLEPRVLLSAEASFVPEFQPLDTFEEQVIEAVVSSQLSVVSEAEEVRSQKAEGRSEETDSGEQRTEDGGQTTGVRSQETEGDGLEEQKMGREEEGGVVSRQKAEVWGSETRAQVDEQHKDISPQRITNDEQRTTNSQQYEIPSSPAGAAEDLQPTTNNQQLATDATFGSITPRAPPTRHSWPVEASSTGQPLATSNWFKEIIFIDEALNQDFQLENAYQPGVVVSVFDTSDNGLDHITNTLSGYAKLSAIHIISHGAPGLVRLGTGELNAASLTRNAGQIGGWGDALTPHGDILLYGCSIAEGEPGLALVDQIAELTGADVAASADATGAVSLGGNWDLEARTGPIEATLLSEDCGAQFNGTLAVIYVDSGASGADNGGSWADAVTDLQDALAMSGSGDEIWVAAGTYRPTSGSDRTISFVLIDGVGIYGGFAGGETARGQRDWETYTTTLSGDIGVGGADSDNSFQVVASGAVGGSAVLDGFSITTGNANGLNPYDRGGGLFNSFGSPTISNCTFAGNTAEYGGGMYSYDGSPTVSNCTFDGNYAEFGGGMYNHYASTTLVNCTFSGNSASSAGSGIGNSDGSSLMLRNTLLADNGVDDLYNTATVSSAYNIIETYTGFTPDATDITGDQPSLNLGPLADNGGETRTHALLAGSVAIDAGTAVGAPGADQRGYGRVGQTDIGAYEFVPTIPTVSTTTPTAVTASGATGGGNVTDDGGAFVTARGVCWSESANPDTGDSCTSDGSGSGAYASALTGLASNTTYHVRAYATNSVGTAYGADLTFTTTAPTVTFTSTSQSGAENAGTMTITAQLSVASGLAVTVPFTPSGTATGGGMDYSITASPVIISAGATTQTITITINDDTVDEDNETVIVTMGSPTNALQGATTIHTATIFDNDSPPTITGTTAGQNVNDNGTMTPFTGVTIGDDDVGGLDVTVTLSTAANGVLTSLGSFTDAGGGVYTLTAATPADATTAIRALTFDPTENQVEVGSTITTTFTIDVEDGTAPTLTDTTTTVSAVSINDQPVGTNTTHTIGYTEGGASVALDPDMVLSDPDLNESITATLTLVNTATGDLTSNNGATYTPGTGIWMITGTVAAVNTALAGVAFVPVSTNRIDSAVTVNIADGRENGAGAVTGTIVLDVTALPRDYGDAPTGAPPDSYPTLLVNNGARHIMRGPHLGLSVDGEDNGIPDADALGDDNDNTDDEDGVIFTTSDVFVSTTSDLTLSVQVDLRNADATSNRLDAWVDFNRDGDWDDAGEQILVSADLGTTDGTVVLSFTVPQDAGANVELGATFARFRLSTAGGLLPTGEAPDGEVEDYNVTISPLEITKSIAATSETYTADPYVAIGEIVRYRLEVALPEGSFPNLQMRDLLPEGLLFLDDGTAMLALVSDNAPMASSDPAGDSLGLGLGAGAFGTLPWVNGSDPALVNPTFVLPDVNVGDDNALDVDNDVYASGTDPWFKLGDIVNNDDDANGEYIILEFNVLVMNIDGNDAGVSRANQARVHVGASQLIQSGTVSITIAEPSITDLDKTVNPTTGDAGDQVDFTITFSNAGGADNTSALNARVLDALPADLSLLPASVVVTPSVGGMGVTDNSAGDTLDIAIDEIPAGESVTVEYSATIDGTASPTQVITNTATLTYTSTPGADGSGLAGSTIPGAAGESTGERDDSDGAGGLNGYTDDDDADVTVDNLTLAKSIDDTSGAHTAGSTVAIGEIVRYRLVAQLPQGTSENFQIQDDLPDGLLFLDDGTATLALVSDGVPMASSDPAGDSLGLGLGAGTFAPATPPWMNGSDPAVVDPTFVLPDVNVGGDDSLAADNDVYNSGADPWFKLGSIVNDDDANGEYVVIEFNALVMNIADNDAGASLSNLARAFVDGVQLRESGSVSITTAEPSITNVAKGADPTSGDAGDQVNFTVTFSNANGADNSSALDARVLDALPADMTYLGNVNVTGGGAWVDNSVGDTVDIVITEVVKGANVTVTYSATIDVTAAPNQVITNTATLTYTSAAGANGSGLAGSAIPGAPGDDDGERNHSGGVDDYTDNDDASVTMDNLALAMTIDDTSEASTVDPYVAVGEIVRYRLTVTLPEGTMENLQLSDLLPAGMLFLNDGTATLALVSDDAPMASTDPTGDSLGLGLGAGTFAPVTPAWVNGTNPAVVDPTFVLPDVNVGADNSLAADNDAYGSDPDPWFKLGTIVNADSDDDGEYAIIEFNALVMNIAGNDAGVSRSSQARAYVNGSQLIQSGSVSITIAEPSITDMDKSVNLATGDAGDQMDFTVTFGNANGAANTSAFDARVLDTLPGGLSLIPASIGVAGAGAWVDNSPGDDVDMDITITEVTKGANVTVTYSAIIDASAAPAQEITNEATLTYTSLPGAHGSSLAGSTTPGAAGSGTGERDHSDGAGGLNDYIDDDDAMVTIDSPTLNKLVDATSEAATTANEHIVGLDDLTVGETATFRIISAIPEGTTPSVVFIDTLPYTNGVMEVVSSRVVSIGGDATPGVTDGGNLNTADLLAVNAAAAHSDVQLVDGLDETVTFDFGQVVNTPDGADTVEDEIVVEVVARLKDLPANIDGDQLTNSALLQFGPGLDVSNSVDVEVVEPLLVIDKSGDVNSGDAGDVVTFTVHIQHAWTSTADAFDLVITDVIPGDMTYVPLSLSDTGALAPDTLAEAGGTITATWDVFPRGSVGEFTFQAVLNCSVAPNTTVTNRANAAWDTLPADGDPEERDHTDSDDHGVLITLPGAAKTVFATSEASTGSGINGPEEDLTIGEQVTYRFTCTLPEGTTASLEVSDQLPTGTSVFSLISSRVVRIGANLSGAGLLAPGAPGVHSNTNADAYDDHVEWTLGDVLNTPDGFLDADDEIEFEVVAVVVDEALNQGGVDNQINTATIDFANGSVSATVPVDLVEPLLAIDKSGDVGSGDVGDVVTFTVNIQHTGASTTHAFDLVVTDLIPAGMTYVGASLVNTSATAPDSLVQAGGASLRSGTNFYAGAWGNSPTRPR